jgi:ABC-type multidrug transport system permease subunit
MTLVHRQFTEILRNPLFLWVRVALYAALGVMIATVWLGVDNDDPSTLQDRFSMFFFSVAFLCFCASSAVPAFVSDRLVFQRERASRAYGPFAYLVANSITSLAMVLLIAAVYSAIVYRATNLNRDPERVAGFCLALFLALLVAEWIVILISATTRYMIVGITIASMVNGVTMVVQGFFVRKTSLPGFYRNTLHYISYQKYAFEMMMTNDLRGDTFACGANADGSARCQFPTRIAGATRMTGEEILEDFTYEDVVYAEWAVILVALAVIARIITYTVLKLRK